MTRTRWIIGIVVLIAAIVGILLGTGTVRTPDYVSILEIRRHRALWQNQGIKDYQFVLRMGCFCPAEYTNPVRITIRNGHIVDAVYTELNEPIPAQRRAQLPTLDELFDVAEDYAYSADSVTLHFDASYGFLSSLSVDQIKNAIDDELGYSMSEFAPVR